MTAMRNRDLLMTLLLAGVALLARCSMTSLDSMGGSSGTEVSALTGMVTDPDGNPIANADVRLRPVRFLPDSLASSSYVQTHSIVDTVTGSNGGFSIVRLFPGDYHIEIIYRDSIGTLIEAKVQGTLLARLPVAAALPLATLAGNVQINYSSNSFTAVQVFGMQRSIRPDSLGNFVIKVPEGKHRLHIGGYVFDSTASGTEFDGIDVSLQVAPGENKDVGTFRLKPPPPPPCPDGTCDSAVVRYLLDAVGLVNVSRSEVTRIENGRVVELNLRGRNLSGGIPPDINKLVALRLLDLGQTGLPNMFPDMGRMSQLEIVRLDRNRIPVFSSTVGNLTRLRELDLYGNELTALPGSILFLNTLTYLNVGNNHLCAVDSATAAWIDRYDRQWRTNQRCR
ncbi:MAG: carboxypeptidase regulatory-like domain-containing protein [Chitinispirillaceae bacterium]|nr:carboxypeptidase regulatory-like domain-containing protein [Chitinispirillaceae bacterium]